jgi:hypothetical protein
MVVDTRRESKEYKDHLDLLERLKQYKVGPHDGPAFHPIICDEAVVEIEHLRGIAMRLAREFWETKEE